MFGLKPKEPEKKNNILNIFDDVPEPKIDPKEKKQQSVLDDIFGESKKGRTESKEEN